jgi:hypothetical protein
MKQAFGLDFMLLRAGNDTHIGPESAPRPGQCNFSGRVNEICPTPSYAVGRRWRRASLIAAAASMLLTSSQREFGKRYAREMLKLSVSLKQ